MEGERSHRMPDELSTMQKTELWNILVDTVHVLPMYKNHKRYVEGVMLKEKPEISSRELAIQINVTLGEAIVILDELRGGKHESNAANAPAGPPKGTDRSLLDFAK
jgi:hypothetical protein